MVLRVIKIKLSLSLQHPMRSSQITSIEQNAKFERWMWIELIGFDVQSRDFGVRALFKKCGFTPQAITLLLSDAEFVHGHKDDSNRVFGANICSYEGHPSNEERERQVWTARDLTRLIHILRSKGVQVYFTHFDFAGRGWLKKHQELRILNRHGERIDFISPYKRVLDGRLYRDIYVPQAIEAIQYFGFDGYHAGDGFAHPRVPIYEGDFSDDSIAQFEEWTNESLPKGIRSAADESPKKIQARAKWLWQEKRLQWVEFHRWRSLNFWQPFAECLHALKKQLVFNSCWTRDPFEALYRYGVDYAALETAGVDTFLAETASAAHEYGGDLPYGEEGVEDWSPHHVVTRFSTKLSLLRAAAPKAKIIFMNGIKDTNEAWNGIRHAPTNVESEILSHSGLFQIDDSGKYRRSANGVISVLSDGLATHEWKWITNRWDLGFSLNPRKALGAAVYWSSSYPKTLVEDYISNRSIPFDRIVWKLRANGAPLLATVRRENLDSWAGPLIVIHPHLLPSEEWHEIMERQSTVFTLGGPAPRSPKTAKRMAVPAGSSFLQFFIYNWKGIPPKRLKPPKVAAVDPALNDPFQWLADLPAPTIPDETYRHLADWINTSVSGIRIEKYREDLRAWGYEVGGKKLRVYVRNESFYYRTANVNIGRRKCGQIRTLTSFPANPVTAVNSSFRFKMAGKSTAVFEITLK